MLRYRVLLYLLIITIAFTGCAKRGTISGGPIDTIPPTITGSSPKNMSTEFRGDQIRISFDEYIKIKDVSKQLIISPPMDTPPTITPMGSASKSIDIKIKDTLQPNTTYSFNFGQSISDNNEGNPYSQFRFVFSTGAYIDSLALNGKIKDAVSRKADNFVTVMLYEDNETFNDSTIYNERPRYVTNTLDSMTYYSLQNLKEGRYRLFALKDVNNNYRFNPKSDKIAFMSESISVPTDTLYELELFKEELPYNAKKPKQVTSNRLFSGYTGNTKAEEIEIKVTNPSSNESINTVITKVADKDSLQVWLPRNITADSLQVNVTYRDSVNDFMVRFKEIKATDSLAFTAKQKGTLHFREQFTLQSSTPLINIDTDKITLVKQDDSTTVPYTHAYDAYKQELEFNFEKEENQKYYFTLLPGAMRDFYRKENDTLQYQLATKSLSDYGNMRVKLINVNRFPLILQLTNAKEEIKAEYYSEGETEISFDAILPDEYVLRVIYDDNKNGKWDTGNYLEKRQPEQIIYKPGTPIKVLPNWDVDETFNLGG